MTLPSSEMSEAARVALAYKAELNNQILSLSIEMAAPWDAVHRAIIRAMDELEQEIKSLRHVPEELRITWLRKRGLYQSFEAQLLEALSGYSGDARGIIMGWQGYEAERGLEEALTLIRASSVGMLPPNFNRLPIDALETLIGGLQQDTPLVRLLSTAEGLTVWKVRDAMTSGLALGKPLREIGRNLAEVSNIGLNRALTIARTEVIRARRLATWSQFQESSSVLDGWRRMANPKSACMACLALDGTIHPIWETLDDHPNGACTAVPIVKGAPIPQWETGLEYFLRLPESEQKARMGEGKYEAWKKGAFQLSDLVTWQHSDEWGDSPQVPSLSSLLGN